MPNVVELTLYDKLESDLQQSNTTVQLSLPNRIAAAVRVQHLS